jgi:hypothetical protein
MNLDLVEDECAKKPEAKKQGSKDLDGAPGITGSAPSRANEREGGPGHNQEVAAVAWI